MKLTYEDTTKSLDPDGDEQELEVNAGATEVSIDLSIEDSTIPPISSIECEADGESIQVEAPMCDPLPCPNQSYCTVHSSITVPLQGDEVSLKCYVTTDTVFTFSSKILKGK